jgi:hypothetical protein
MPAAVPETKCNRPARALCLVHLIRAANGTAPLASFLASYRERSAGIEHDLVLLLKGFASPEQAQPHLKLARDLDAEHLFVSDDTLDLGAYLVAAERLRRERYCFVNSFSVVLADGWLGMLDRALAEHGVGMVGATGSWASPRSQALRQRAYVPCSAYHAAFPDRRWMVEQFELLQREQAGEADVRLAGLRRRINTWRSLLEILRSFGPFPSPHLRTNAFMLSAQTLQRLALGRSRRKAQTYRLESGKRGITRQVQELGLRTQVVSRTGASFEPEDWHLSRTFWQGDQEQLLVADNQTQTYANGDLARRTLLAGLAWGELADVTAPASQPGERFSA